jgi:predicted GNAT family acetyltransferase
MNVDLVETAQEFVTATTAFRAADPVRTNVIGSVSLSIADGDRVYDDYRWWVVRDDGEIVGIAMRTSPFNMVVSPMPSEAARALGRRLGDHDDALPGVTGSKDVTDALVEGYVETNSPGARRTIVVDRRDLLYELDELVTPDVEGVGRPARADDADLLTSMLRDFMREAELTPNRLSEARDTATRKIKEGSLFCWEFDADVVAMAGHANLVPAGDDVIGRVGPVYTPPQYRRNGYGSAVTAHVTRSLIEKGARVMLYTDASNPTSNSIYQTIGYRLVDEFVELRFEDV